MIPKIEEKLNKIGFVLGSIECPRCGEVIPEDEKALEAFSDLRAMLDGGEEKDEKIIAESFGWFSTSIGGVQAKNEAILALSRIALRARFAEAERRAAKREALQRILDAYHVCSGGFSFLGKINQELAALEEKV